MAFVVEVGLYLYFFGEEEKGKMIIMGWAIGDLNTAVLEKAQAMDIALLA